MDENLRVIGVDETEAALLAWLEGAETAVYSACEVARTEIEEAGKNEHDWKDDTGDTREFTHATIEELPPDEVKLALVSPMIGKSKGHSGGASYWLEVKNEDRGYAWMKETVEDAVPDLLTQIEIELDAVGEAV